MIQPASSERPAEVEEVVDGSLVLEGEAMLGDSLEKTEDSDTGEQLETRPVRTSATPKLPSLKEIEIHNMSHLTYRSWCPFCVAGKRANTPHRRQWDKRTVPLLVGDFCFARSSQDAETTTMFVGKVVPQNVTFAMAVDVKGATPQNVARLAKVIRDIGLTKFAYISDQEKGCDCFNRGRSSRSTAISVTRRTSDQCGA